MDIVARIKEERTVLQGVLTRLLRLDKRLQKLEEEINDGNNDTVDSDT